MTKMMTLEQQEQELETKLAEIRKLREQKSVSIENAEQQIETLKARATDIVQRMKDRKTNFQTQQTKDKTELVAANTQIAEIVRGLKANGFIPPENFNVRISPKGELLVLAKPGRKASKAKNAAESIAPTQ